MPISTPSLYQPGMTAQQFMSALQSDPGYQAIIGGGRGPDGQLTPAAWNRAVQYAGAAGLYELNAASRQGDPASAFRGGNSNYTIDGNGTLSEQHDSGWSPQTAGTALAMGLGGWAGAAGLAALGAGGGAGAGGAAATGAAGGVEGGAVAGLSPYVASGVLGPSAAGAGAAGAGAAGAGAAGAGAAAAGSAAPAAGVPWSTILDYGVSAGGAALASGQNQSNLQDELTFRREQLRQQRDLANQKTAVDESTMDPFRGYMTQGRDMGRLDLMLQGAETTPVQPDAKYGAGFTPSPRSYTPSALTRQVLTSARDNVSNGRTVPTMTDPANWGKTPVVSLDGSNPNGQPFPPPGGPAPSTMLLAGGRRRPRNRLDDQRSPWLEGA